MRATFRRLAPLALALFVVVGTTLPARASNQLLHFGFARALAANPLDSTLVTLSTTSFDTTFGVLTDNIDPSVLAAVDSNNTSGTIGSAAGAITHIPKNMALVVEVTGSLQSQDSIYVGFQFSQGPTSSANGSSGNQSNQLNWRWYDAALTSASGAAVLANATGSQTFVFPVPCQVGGPNAWVWAKYIRFVVQGDTNAAAKAFSTRAWLLNRP